MFRRGHQIRFTAQIRELNPSALLHDEFSCIMAVQATGPPPEFLAS